MHTYTYIYIHTVQGDIRGALALIRQAQAAYGAKSVNDDPKPDFGAKEDDSPGKSDDTKSATSQGDFVFVFFGVFCLSVFLCVWLFVCTAIVVCVVCHMCMCACVTYDICMYVCMHAYILTYVHTRIHT